MQKEFQVDEEKKKYLIKYSKLFVKRKMMPAMMIVHTVRIAAILSVMRIGCVVLFELIHAVEQRYTGDAIALTGVFFGILLFLFVVFFITKGGIRGKLSKLLPYLYDTQYEKMQFKTNTLVYSYMDITGKHGIQSKYPYYEYIFRYSDVERVEYDSHLRVYRIFGYPTVEEWSDISKEYHDNTIIAEKFKNIKHKEVFPRVIIGDYLCNKEQLDENLRYYLGEKFVDKERV